jgi:hypothetical protein
MCRPNGCTLNMSTPPGFGPADALIGAAADADRILRQLTAALDAGGVAPSTLLSVVGEWVDRMARLAKVIIDSRIDERRLALEAAQLQLVRVAVGRAIAAAGLDLEQRAMFLRVLGAELKTAPLEIEAGERRESMRLPPGGPGDG